MAKKSWHLDRREFLRGSGLALGLPLLESMGWARPRAQEQLPRRMVASYIAYGGYEPRGEDGQHHDWSWWPCAEPGPLRFNASSAAFEPLAPHLSYLRGLDHAGGYGMGGHSSGDSVEDGSGTIIESNGTVSASGTKNPAMTPHGPVASTKTRENSNTSSRITNPTIPSTSMSTTRVPTNRSASALGLSWCGSE